MRKGIALLIACLLTQVASAQVYQWRDAEGKLHFTDTPPPQSQPEKSAPLQVNTMKATRPSRSEHADNEASDERVGQVQEAKAHQEGLMQCSSAIRNMPSLISDVKKLGRKAVREGRISQSKFDDALDKMKEAAHRLKRQERECAEMYSRETRTQWAVDCLADSDDAKGLALCMQFGELANSFF